MPIFVDSDFSEVDPSRQTGISDQIDQFIATDEGVAIPGGARRLGSLGTGGMFQALMSAGSGYMLTDPNARIIGIIGLTLSAGIAAVEAGWDAGTEQARKNFFFGDKQIVKTFWLASAAGYAVGRMVNR